MRPQYTKRHHSADAILVSYNLCGEARSVLHFVVTKAMLVGADPAGTTVNTRPIVLTWMSWRVNELVVRLSISDFAGRQVRVEIIATGGNMRLGASHQKCDVI